MSEEIKQHYEERKRLRTKIDEALEEFNSIVDFELIVVEKDMIDDATHFLEEFLTDCKWWKQHKKYEEDYERLTEVVEYFKACKKGEQ